MAETAPASEGGRYKNFEGEMGPEEKFEIGGADGVRTHDLPGFTGTRSATAQSFGDLSTI
jgi:hypothetical protein